MYARYACGAVFLVWIGHWYCLIEVHSAEWDITLDLRVEYFRVDIREQ